jgi:hypothetical protein
LERIAALKKKFTVEIAEFAEVFYVELYALCVLCG